MPLVVLALAVVATLPLDVRIYDAAGVPPDVLERAHVTVEQTLNAIGIKPVWHPCHAGLCVDSPRPDEMKVRNVAARRLSPPQSLGTSMVDVAGQAGTLATVYHDRVRWLAVEANVDDGQLLGRAIAHEIGHLLLGTATHGQTGLMRARWLRAELRRDLPIDWVFSAVEGSSMRCRLIARGEQATAR